MNYPAVGQIYLMANPLLGGPLRPEHVKPRLSAISAPCRASTCCTLTQPVIKADDLDVAYAGRPGPRRAGAECLHLA